MKYEVIDLGALDDAWHYSGATSINNLGQIVGTCENWETHTHRATLFDSSGSGNNIDLGTLGGTRSRARCINDAGQIVGTADAIIHGDRGIRATLFDPSGGGNNIDLGTFGGLHSQAFSVNNLGQIVGHAYYPNSQYHHAALFDPSGRGNNIDLGTLGGLESRSSTRSINNHGQIVGHGIAVGPDSTAFISAALFDETGSGGNIDLGTLGGPDSYAYSINDHGRIVGWFEVIYGNKHRLRATLFDPSGGGNNINLDPFSGPEDSSWAESINNNGQIVGTIQFDGTDPRATLFDPSGAGNNIDLNTLIEPASGWTLRRAHSINDLGWIVGNGVNPEGQPRAFLLTPEPATLFLLGLGGLMLSKRRRA
jgi:probable HAF family extracellular repeat protein